MSIEISSIAELRRAKGPGIFAVAYRAGRRRSALRLPDGAIVEVPEPDRLAELAERPQPVLGVAFDGSPAGGRHACLGLIADHIALTGVYLLPGGELAAVYGAEAVPIG